MDCNLKKLANDFTFIALCLGKLTETHIMVDFLFENSFDIFL